MNSQRLALRVSSIFFGLVCIVHLWRLFFAHFTVQIGSHVIPVGASWVFVIIGALLCFWMWKAAAR